MTETASDYKTKRPGFKEIKADVKEQININFNVDLIEWFDEHYYKIILNGETLAFPSPTTILQVTDKSFINKKRGDMGNQSFEEYVSEAQDRGTAVHRACETLATGGIVVYANPQRPNFSILELKEKYKNENIHVVFDQFQYLQAYRFEKFLHVINPKILSTEKIVYNLQHEYAGKMDLELLLNNEDIDFMINGSKALTLENGIYIADVKSGKGVYQDNYLQVSAYMKAYQKMFPNKKLQGGLILHTNSQTKTGIEGLSVKLITLEDADKYFNDFLKIYEVWKINPSPSKPKFFELPSVLQYK